MKSVILCLLDGWGCTEERPQGNAILNASTPFLDKMLWKFQHAYLNTCGITVGLPAHQIGSSEVGHTTIGSGRTIYQNLLRINNELKFLNKSRVFEQFVSVTEKKVCHVIGMISDGGVHSHEDHILHIVQKMEKRGLSVYLHCISDGRDTNPKSAAKHIAKISEKLKKLKNCRIATLCGRYYAMDRDRRTERTKAAYNCIVNANGYQSSDLIESINKQYSEEITDEFFPPMVFSGYSGINPGESIFIANFRADRIIQLASELKSANFNIAGMTKYSNSLDIPYLFEVPEEVNTLSQVISQNNLKQLKIAETEKYAHATYFFNAKKEEPFPGEEQILISSPQVANYESIPAMSAYKTTDICMENILKKEFSFIFINYANADMLGHTGNFEATKVAISVIDKCLEKLFNACNSSNSTLIITADHGNAENMYDCKGLPHTSHTANPVPFVIFDENISIKQNGLLKDIAPTILHLLNLSPSKEMTGQSLILAE